MSWNQDTPDGLKELRVKPLFSAHEKVLLLLPRRRARMWMAQE